MQEWQKIALQMRSEKNGSKYKYTIQQIAEVVGVTYNQADWFFKSHSRNGNIETKTETPPQIVFDGSQMLLNLLERGASIESITEKLKVSKRLAEAYIDDLKEKGYCIENDGSLFVISKNIAEQQENIHNQQWDGSKIIRFGLKGDTHSNSKFTQLTHLHKYYDIIASEGIDTVYDTGDIDEGVNMRVGHNYEQYTQGADEHIDEIAKNYPKRNGVVTKFITGNHDASLIKNAGFDIGVAIANKRSDMIYLGQSFAVTNLTPNCNLELRHPWDGTAYAISYKIQKIIEAMSGGEKPKILAVGNYHKIEYLFYRNVHAIQTGCFQAQTPFMRGKGISAHMGGWIVEIRVNDEGTIERFKTEFIPFYYAIKDDYLNWR